MPAPEPLPISAPDDGPYVDRRALRAVPRPRRGLLAGLRIRKKLILLHTCFSLTLALVLLVVLKPTLRQMVDAAEIDEARFLLRSLGPTLAANAPPPRIENVTIRTGPAGELSLDADSVARATAAPGRPVGAYSAELGPCAVLYVPAHDGVPDTFHALAASIPETRAAVTRLYVLLVIALLAVYALVAAALEVFVLPQAVWRPIRSTLAADLAVQQGRRDEELIDEKVIPDDELGEIMRSRNRTVGRLRYQEAALADALGKLETVANDLKRKNHLLEAARRNLADADRLASLGMMSAGIAHELNTPLAVLKGLVEKLNADPASINPAQARLMLRVVGRLERLGDGLLDFARVRPPQTRPADLRTLVQDAADLVRLDRDAAAAQLVNAVPGGLSVECDADRLVQVFVNLLRNALDAIATSGAGPSAASRTARVAVAAERQTRESRDWISIAVTDDGPGIDPAILPRLFEPFASTRLDARGTGLGLAVAEGIVREHAGLLLARNRPDAPGAVFEVLIPAQQLPASGVAGPGVPPAMPALPALNPASSTLPVE